MDTTARILLHVFTAAAAGFIHFVNGKWGQASREVLAWNDYCGFRRIGTSPLGPRLSSSTKEDAQQLLRHRVSGVTTADSRDSSVGVGPWSQLFFFPGHQFSVSSSSSSSSGHFLVPGSFAESGNSLHFQTQTTYVFLQQQQRMLC
jgi:hypothetical protein